MAERYLLDTHTVLWFLGGDEKLSPKAKRIISDADNICFLSMASIWEIAIKVKLGKLQLGVSLQEFYNVVSANSIKILPISFDHINQILKLEDIHRDPFDRMILAQAFTEQLIILSRDNNFIKYKMSHVVW